MESPEELNPKIQEGLTDLEYALLKNFEVGETKLFFIAKLTNSNLIIEKLIKKGYLENVDKLHHPSSATWRLKRIK